MSELTVIAVIDTNYIIRFFKNPDKPKQKEFFLKELKKLILSGQVLLIKPVKDELMNFNFEDEIIK